MDYTLDDLLKSRIIPESQLLTSQRDFSKKIITGISVQEMPLDDFIQENEIILTTAIGCLENPEFFITLFQNASAAKATAVILCLKDEIYTPPKTSLTYADSVNLPVLSIPWKYRFATIQKEVLEAIQEKRLGQYKELQTLLCNLFFENKSLEDAARAIYRLLHISIEIRENDEKLLASSDNVHIDSVENEPPATYIEKRIQIRGIPFGILRLYTQDSTSNQLISDALLNRYILFPLSLWFNRKGIEDSMTMRIKNEFVRNLAHGTYNSFEEITRQGVYLSLDLNIPYTCLVMQLDFLHKDEDQSNIYSNKTAETTMKIETLLLEESRRLNRKLLVGNENMIFIMFLENKDSHAESTIMKFINIVESKTKIQFPYHTFHWGISEIETDSKPDFTKFYNDAMLALQYCLNNKDTCYRFTYKDTKKALIISTLSKEKNLQKYAEETLQALIDYDRSSNIELFRTLTEYIKTNYNISQTARNLHLHRQSLLYRLEKLSKLTGADLNNHDDLFVLECLARIHHNF